MKILLVTYWGLTNMGGIWTYMRQLSDKLGEQGHSVTLMGSHVGNNTLYLLDQNQSFDKKAYYDLLLPQLDPVRFPHLHQEHGIFSFELGRYVFEGGAAGLGLEDYDVIHAQDPISSYALRRTMKTPVPLVSSVHGALAREAYYEYKGLEPGLTMQAYENRPIWRYFRRLEQLGAGAADLILVSSEWLGQLVRGLGINGKVIHTLPYGLNLQQYAVQAAQPSPLPSLMISRSGRKVIMYAGRLEYIKGVHVLISALGRLKHRRDDWICIIAGVGSLEAELKAQAAELGVAERMVFAGKLDNMPAALAAADIYVQPSLQDTQPYSVTEAQLAGIAPIVTGTAGMPEMVRHGETGWIMPPENDEVLAALLERLLREDALRSRTGKQAREWAVRFRSLDVMTEGTLKVYRKAAALQAGRQREEGRHSVEETLRSGLPHAFHPADLLQEIAPGHSLEPVLRSRLPLDYRIPDGRISYF
jgi:glycosyltransferase involved in cell wall biosynthesis